MLAVVGTLLLSAALFIFAWARTQHLRTRPARWARHELASQLVVFLILMFVAGGAGLIVHVVGHYESNPVGFVDGSLIAAIIVATLLLLTLYRRYSQPFLGVSGPRGTMGPMDAVQTSGRAEGELDPGPPPGRSPGGRRRRAA